MGRAASGSDGFGREVILGLLAEEPSCAYQLDRRLSERFGSAGYTNGMASKTVKRLHRDGLVRPVDSEAFAAAADGVSRTASVVYEATPAGIDHFRRWMWASVSAPPVREELHAKIALCQPDDLPRMIDLVRKAEVVCAGKLQDLNREVQARRIDADPEQWSLRMDLVVSTGDQAWWESRISWLQRVHLFLEKEWQRYQAQSPVLFSGERYELGIVQIADLAGLNRSTAHRYASTLVQLGYLEQRASRRYRLTARPAEPGLNLIGSMRRASPMLTALEELRDATGHTVSLGALDRTHVTYIHRVYAHGLGQYHVDQNMRAGTHIPIHCTALGKALLASLTDMARRRIVAEIAFVPYGPSSIMEPIDLIAELEGLDYRKPIVSDESFCPVLDPSPCTSRAPRMKRMSPSM
jgi:DNA-binding IclR family transcriptional regulator/DNA-binding PadR family transcriptional regulator